MIRPAAAADSRRTRTLGRRWLAAGVFVGAAGLTWDAAVGESGRWQPVNAAVGEAGGTRVEAISAFPDDPFAAVRDPFAAVRTVAAREAVTAVEAVEAVRPVTAGKAPSPTVAAATGPPEPAPVEPPAGEAPAELQWWGAQAAAPEAILRAAEPPSDLEWWEARRTAAELGWWIVPRPGARLDGGDLVAQGPGGTPGATSGNTGGAGVGVGGGGTGSPLGGGGLAPPAGGLGAGGLGSGGLGSGGAGSNNLGPNEPPIGGGSSGTPGGLGNAPGFGDRPLGPLRRDDLRPGVPGTERTLPGYGTPGAAGPGSDGFPQLGPEGYELDAPAPLGAKNPFAVLPARLLKPLSDIRVGMETPQSKLPNPPVDPAREFFASYAPVYVSPQSWPNHTPLGTAFRFRSRPLWFEDANLERCGYTHGCLQPVVSGTYFFASIPLVPYVFAAQPQCVEVPTKPFCPPGCKYDFADNYLPPPSAAGTVTEAAAVAGLILLIP